MDRASSAVDSVVDRIIPPSPEGKPADPPGLVTIPDAAPQASGSKPATASGKEAGGAGATSQISALASQIAAFDLKQPPAGLLISAAPIEPPAGPDTVVDGMLASSRIYTEKDSEVSAPVAVYPQLPSTLPPDTPKGALAVIDLVIDDSGRVETVKLRDAPTTMADAMVLTMGLSAAKTWRFQPALKDGRPVRYRKSIWVLTR